MKLSDLSIEQRQFIAYAKRGCSILVEACIGSGKTTAIQALCNVLPQDKSILYLTYNKLLKLDAKARIQKDNVDVTNYHGFACRELMRNHVRTSMQESVATYCRMGFPTRHYDILILDEYQDIDQEISEMLDHIKTRNPGLQIIVVGDMAQKIYDSTTLDVAEFIERFMPAGYMKLEFTQCFRLSAGHASMLGEIWGKKIVGVNDDCEVIESMSFDKALTFLSKRSPGEILCLGMNNGKRSEMLNKLEERYPEKFNKHTVWAKISDRDGSTTEPTAGTAIFTTYDSCKGMERDICVIFDWDESYWVSRKSKPNVKYSILRNIFCVAASRGKRKIIFVHTSGSPLSPKTLMTDFGDNKRFEDVPISGMFDFKFDEDIAAAYNTLSLRTIREPDKKIEVPTSDGLIDLSPCIGTYQEAAYFEDYSIDHEIDLYYELNKDKVDKFKAGREEWTIEQKVLFMTSLETSQNRYWQQVKLPFVAPEKWAEIVARLNTRVSPDANVQEKCEIEFLCKGGESFAAKGFCDVLEDDCVIELKFVSELAYTHYLQCASYMVALNKPKGLLWNVHNNQMVEITIPDRKHFMDRVVQAITKGRIRQYQGPAQLNEVKAGPKDNQGKLQKEVEKNTAPNAPAGTRETRSNYSKVISFCQKNAAASNAVVAKVIANEAKGFKCTATIVRNYFVQKGLELPVSPRSFERHFRAYIDMILND